MKKFILIVCFASLSTYSSIALGKTLFSLKGKLNEVSGAVYDPTQDAFWAVGDSGDQVLARVNNENKETEIIPIVGGKIARDREELVMDNEGMLWVLSVGDNHKKRDFVEINQVNPLDYYQNKELEIRRTITITYPHGAIDVEGAFIFEETLYLIQKNFFGKTWIYTVDISHNAKASQEAKRFKRLTRKSTAKLITAACIDENEDVFIQTYWGTFKLRNWKDAKKIKPKKIKLNPTIGQVETLICYNGKLVLARESGKFWYL